MCQGSVQLLLVQHASCSATCCGSTWHRLTPHFDTGWLWYRRRWRRSKAALTQSCERRVSSGSTKMRWIGGWHSWRCAAALPMLLGLGVAPSLVSLLRVHL